MLLAVVLIASFAHPTFATLDNARGTTVQASFLAVVALGMPLVVITGGIDLPVGSVFALGGVLAARASQWGLFPALLVPLVVCGVFGLLNGLLIARAGMAPLIVTLATLLAAGGILLASPTRERRRTSSRRTRPSPDSGRAASRASVPPS